MDSLKLIWRKTTDVDREHAIFELVSGDVILLDVGFSDGGEFEIAFHEGISNQIIDWNNFLRLLQEGRRIAEIDK